MGKRHRKQSSGLTEKPLFEGSLIRNQNKYALEFRKNDGELQTVVKNVEANPDKLIKKIPFVRGIFVLVQNLILVLESLEFTADAFGNDTTKETIFDKLLGKLFGRHTNIIVTAVTACISFVMCLLFVTAIPILLARFLERYIINKSVINIIEFAASVFIIVIYLLSLLLFKDVRRMMKYHAAEHMCINCIERGRKLNYKNVASSSRFFTRCSTNYIAFCTFLSVILFVFVRIDSVPLRLLFRLLYIPLATGLFYELYVLICNLPDCAFLRILTAPSVAFQFFSLIKPDDEMITTAMASLEAVIDWREFLVINFPNKYSSDDFALNKSKNTQNLPTQEELEKEMDEELIRAEEELLRAQEELEDSILHYGENEDEYSKEGNFEENDGIYTQDSESEEYYGSDESQDGEYDYYETLKTESEEYEQGYYSDDETYYEDNAEDGPYREDNAEEEYNSEDDMYQEDNPEEEYYPEEDTYREDNVEEYYSEDETYQEGNSEEDLSEEDDLYSAQIDESEELKYYKNQKDNDYADGDIYEESDESYKVEFAEDVDYDNIEEGKVFSTVAKEDVDMTKTQPVSIDFTDDYGFDPEEEEVPENKMKFEPVDEKSATEDLSGVREYIENDDPDAPLFSKDIESIPMPESLDNIVEVMPQGGVKPRVYINSEEAEKNEFDDDDDDIDFDNIIDEHGHLTLKDTDAFNRMLDDEYDEIFKRLGLDSDDV